MIKFSIVTVTYNASKTLLPTLKSVFEQDYPLIEHIIVDGASKDGTLSLANKYKEETKEKFPQREVITFSEKDSGIYDAMNKALRLFQGDYICFLNSGDAFPEPQTLSKIVSQTSIDKIQKDRLPGVLYGNTDIVDANGKFLYKRRLQPPERLSWRSFKHGMLVCHQAFYARGDIAKKTLYDLSYRFSSDVDWTIRIMKTAEKSSLPIVNTHLTLVNYLNEGLTTRNHKSSLIERFTIMRRHYGLCTTIKMHISFVARYLKRK